MKTKSLFISLTLGLGLTLALLGLLCDSATPVIAAPAERPLSDATPIHYVTTTGTDSGDCSTPISACLTIQYAVDQAGPGDEIRVASGVYTGVSVRGGVTQVTYISKTLAIQGGYTTTNWITPYPITQPTTIDAQDQGRVLYITGDISPTVEGLCITGGDATGLGGGPGGDDAGGGLYLDSSDATLSGNTVAANTADYGGGLYLDSSDATLSGNTISDNIAESGGGLYLDSSDAMLSANIVISNTAYSGGGLFLSYSDATLSNNTITANTANGTDWLNGGGGLYLSYSDATLSGNTITANTANGTNWYNGGGGLYLSYSDATLTNTLIADNQANNAGSGLYILSSLSHLLHTTVARNSDGSGVYVANVGPSYSTVWMTNTILVSHTVGIAAMLGNTAILESTLWGSGAWVNGVDTDGTGTIITGTNNYTGDPAFADPDTGDYHIGLGSAAIDAGVDAGVTADIDGESRPTGTGYDLGADEFLATLSVTKEAASDPVQAGAQLTYTIYVTNTGNIDLHATVTDVLPAHVTPTGTLTWTPTITAPGGLWTQQVVVTVEMGYVGTLTNVVEVTTEEGATGVYTETSEAQVTPMLEVTKEADPDPVQAGAQLTYTIRVTNTGNVDLTATVTDVLPAHVAPTGTLTWTPTITAPGGLWTQQVVVTVEIGYAGTLTNVVEVTTEEGATGVYTEASEAQVTPMLEVTKEADPDPVQAGAQLTYTIYVTNTGNIDLHATVTDVLPAHVEPAGILTWTPAITAPDGVWTQQVVVTVEMGYAGTLTNVVEVTTEEGATGVYTETSEAQVTPMLEVTKEADPDPVQAGAQLTYTIRVTNTGNVDLTATVTDVLPAHVTPTGTLTWTPTVTAPGGVWTQQVVVTVEMGYAGTLTNVVEVTTEEGATGVYTETSEAQVTPMLEVTKEADPDPVQAGAQLTYTIYVTNTGNVDLTATVTDALPAHVTPAGTLTWTPTITAPGGVWTQQVVVTVEMGYAGTLTNVVEVTTEEGATGVYTETSEAQVTPTLEVTKEADQVVVSGSDVTFTITITNIGNVSLTPITVTDMLAPDCDWTGGLAAEDGVSYTCVVTDVTVAFTNTAVVTGTPLVGDVVTATDTAFVDVIGPAIEIVKVPDSQPVQIGGTVTFTISVSNTGDVLLAPITVTDMLAPDCDWTGGLAAGDGVSYTCVVTDVTVAFTNTAVVTGTPPIGGVVTATDTAAVTVEEAIAGLDAINDSPTLLGQTTTLTATITAGSNVTYTWAFGYDGATGSGAVVPHVYPDVGVYTAVVTASNPVSVLTATTTVIITDVPIRGLVAHNNSPTPLGRATTLTVTITAGSNVTYTWAFGYDGATGSGAVLTHTYPATGTYTVIVTASNSVSMLTATTTVTIVTPVSIEVYLPTILSNYTPSAPPPPPTGPDLVVTDISVVPNPPGAGQPATVYVTVKNQGNQAVAYGNNFYVDFYIDRDPDYLLRGDLVWGVQGSWFGVGESRTFSDSYTFIEGTHQLYAQADTDNTVVEANEDNNVLGPVSLNVTSLGGLETPVGPAGVPAPRIDSPRPTPTPEP